MRILRTVFGLVAILLVMQHRADAQPSGTPEKAVVSSALAELTAAARSGFAAIRGAEMGDGGRYACAVHLQQGDEPVVLQPQGTTTVFYVNTLQRGLGERAGREVFATWMQTLSEVLTGYRKTAGVDGGDDHHQEFAGKTDSVRLSREQTADGWSVVLSMTPVNP